MLLSIQEIDQIILKHIHIVGLLLEPLFQDMNATCNRIPLKQEKRRRLNQKQVKSVGFFIPQCQLCCWMTLLLLPSPLVICAYCGACVGAVSRIMNSCNDVSIRYYAPLLSL